MGKCGNKGIDVKNVEEPYVAYNAFKDFTTLECWQKAREVRKFFVEEVLHLIPSEEKYHFKMQIKDALVSITANLAEGYGRFHYREGIQFYLIARGSLFEFKDHLISGLDFGYFSEDLVETGVNRIETAKKSLNGYINYTLNKLKQNTQNK